MGEGMICGDDEVMKCSTPRWFEHFEKKNTWDWIAKNTQRVGLMLGNKRNNTLVISVKWQNWACESIRKRMHEWWAWKKAEVHQQEKMYSSATGTSLREFQRTKCQRRLDFDSLATQLLKVRWVQHAKPTTFSLYEMNKSQALHWVPVM